MSKREEDEKLLLSLFFLEESWFISICRLSLE